MLLCSSFEKSVSIIGRQTMVSAFCQGYFAISSVKNLVLEIQFYIHLFI